ncbi:hypothetical protein Rhal01_02101 [Rubritalea halochordaticola]|uniref:Uncharacterized protein n=1 Tax=Rubritalea halochordaticola TaxID=714537 RepID=A0ABP9V1R3_9BACT
MKTDSHYCSICQSLLVETEAALNRGLINALFFGFGSSELQIRSSKRRWMTFMTPSRNAKALYCVECGSLTLAPSISKHRRELGLE